MKLKVNSIAIGNWDETLHITEVVTMKGNFWKTFGFSSKSKCFLYPEESLLLLERGQIEIRINDAIIKHPEFYSKVVELVGLPCYLTYLKLKTMGYVTLRFQRELKYFSNTEELSREISLCCERSIGYKVYNYTPSWSKKSMTDLKPDGLVLVSACDCLPSGDLMMKMLEFTKEIPLLISNVTSTGYVYLAEFELAELCINLQSEFPFTFNDDTIIQDVVSYTKEMKNKMNQKKRDRSSIELLS